MVLHMNNATDPKRLKFVKKDGRDAILIDLTYEDEGGKTDWRRFGEPGFAQRVQIKLSDLFAVKKGEERWWMRWCCILEKRMFDGSWPLSSELPIEMHLPAVSASDCL